VGMYSPDEIASRGISDLQGCFWSELKTTEVYASCFAGQNKSEDIGGRLRAYNLGKSD
jgi:hypothetical protein